MTRQVPWSRVLAEGLVIVASILLALAADAWWDGKQARSDERSYLTAMLADVEAVAEAATNTLERHASLDDESEEREEAIRSSGQVSDTVFLQSRSRHGAALALRGGLDAYRDLVMSGGVTTLRDSEVRIAMAKLATAIDLQREHALAILDGTAETNLQLASAAVADRQHLGELVVLAEQNGRIMRGFNSGMVTTVLELASGARSAIVAATSAN